MLWNASCLAGAEPAAMSDFRYQGSTYRAVPRSYLSIGKPGNSGGVDMRSDREKMLAGELYDALDPELVAARNRARDLCQVLNASREGDQELRRHLCEQLFGTGGRTVWMQPPFYCDYGSNIELGERVFFNFNCIVLDVCRVSIGDYTLFGPAVQILTPVHPLNAQLRRKQEYGKPIEIGSDVWVGGGALILPGVRIGSRSVIGAGSVVTRDIPEGVFAAGNPCRVIREIADEEAGGH
jgi:maltose O-acetyltransferase